MIWQELKERVLSRYDAEELLMVLNVDSEELVDRLSDLIIIHQEELDV